MSGRGVRAFFCCVHRGIVRERHSTRQQSSRRATWELWQNSGCRRSTARHPGRTLDPNRGSIQDAAAPWSAIPDPPEREYLIPIVFNSHVAQTPLDPPKNASSPPSKTLRSAPTPACRPDNGSRFGDVGTRRVRVCCCFVHRGIVRERHSTRQKQSSRRATPELWQHFRDVVDRRLAIREESVIRNRGRFKTPRLPRARFLIHRNENVFIPVDFDSHVDLEPRRNDRVILWRFGTAL